MRKHDRSYLKDLTYHFEGTYADAVLFGAPIKAPPVIAPVEDRFVLRSRNALTTLTANGPGPCLPHGGDFIKKATGVKIRNVQ